MRYGSVFCTSNRGVLLPAVATPAERNKVASTSRFGRIEASGTKGAPVYERNGRANNVGKAGSNTGGLGAAVPNPCRLRAILVQNPLNGLKLPANPCHASAMPCWSAPPIA